jgi:replicative DNA helicase
MEIVKYGDVAKEALIEIKKFQEGELGVVTTGRPWLDNLFPVVNGSVITIGAGSGIGKSYELARILNNILDKDLNPKSENYVTLNISLEMKVRSLLLRALNKKLGKAKKDILLEEFTEEEKKLANEYFISVNDDRQFISQVPTTPNKFYRGCFDFLTEHKDKESVIIAVDHIALIGADKGEGRNQVIEAFIERVNDLKMQFHNAIFILLSQTNADIIKRAKDRDNMSQPQDSDLYYSNYTFQISDYVVLIFSPLKVGINEYASLNPSRYPHLEKYFLEPDKKGRVALEVFGVLYYHLLKIREGDSGFIDIYAEDLNIPDLEAKRKERKTEKTATPTFIPSFDATPVVTFNTVAMTSAQGAGFDDVPTIEEDEEAPF